MDKEYMSRGEIASLFGVSVYTVTRWGRLGRIPSILTPGGHRRYLRKAIEELRRQLSQERTTQSKQI